MDAEAICRVHLDSIRRLDGPHYSSKQIETWCAGKRPESYVQSMSDGESMFVAIQNGQVVGFGGIRRDEIRAVYVSPDHVLLGAGSLLCGALEAVARGNGFKSVHLSSSIQAEAFYLKMGYKKLADGLFKLNQEVSLEAAKMEKVLL
ncbi:MAG TPA: GNAT family N-acetyltransferase [bacterium]|nr:GNAT family N-acetyltransferase [bacterium]